MPFNPSPHVADCRDIARKWNVKQVIITAFRRDGRFEMASYGETKALCDEAKQVADRIHAMIMDGHDHELLRDKFELAGLQECAKPFANTPPGADLAVDLMRDRIKELQERLNP